MGDVQFECDGPVILMEPGGIDALLALDVEAIAGRQKFGNRLTHR